MHKNYYFLLLFLVSSLTGWAQVTPRNTVHSIGEAGDDSLAQVILSGRVTAVTTGDPLSGAAIRPSGFGVAMKTNDVGQYQLLLFPGTYQMEVEHPDMAPLTFELSIFRSGNLNIRMDYPSKELEEVVLEAYAREEKVNEVTSGVERLSIEDIRLQPALMGEVDVVNSLQWLPGVSQVGEGSAGFNVRGGNIDQNLVLLDGAPLYNPTHLLGFISAFHPDLVQGYSLFKGHVPARHGGRLASVLEVESGPLPLDTFQVKVGLGPISGRAAVQGPIGDQTHVMLGLRGGYLDWLLSFFDDIPTVNNSAANFQEGHFRVNHNLSDNHRLGAAVYATRDFIQIGNRFNYQYQTRVASLDYNGILSENLLIQVSQHIGQYTKSFEELRATPPQSINNGLTYLPGRAQLFWFSEKHQVRTGFNWQYTRGLTEELRVENDTLDIPPTLVDRPQGLEVAFFVEDEWSLTDKWAVSLGLRYVRYGQLGPEKGFTYATGFAPSPLTRLDSITEAAGSIVSQYGGFEPRISVRYKPFETTALRASYHRMRQFAHLISNTAAPTPIDLWLVATDYAPPQVADQYTLGWLQQWGGYRWELSIEGFYKQIAGILEYRDFAELLGAQYLAEQTVPARGQAYGGEFSLQRVRGRLTGRVSYAYVRALNQSVSPYPEVQINGGAWFPANYDQPHQVDILLRYRSGPKAFFAINGVYRSGRPYTPLVGSYYLGPNAVGDFGPRNSDRITPYLRLDASLTITQLAKRYDDELVLSVYNVLGRENAYSFFFQRPSSSVIPRPFKLSVLGVAFPAIVYNVTF